MPKRKIITVEFKFPGDGVECEDIDSHRSLQDADIIVFRPTFGFYQPDDENILRMYHHWESELKMALDAGKTIFALLAEPISFQFDDGWGEKASSDAYEMLPVNFTSIQRGHGQTIVPTNNAKLLSHYWQQFAEYSSFEAYIEGDFTNVLFTTKGGSRTVGQP